VGLDFLAKSPDTGSVRGAIPRPRAGGRQWGENAPLPSGVSLPGFSHSNRPPSPATGRYLARATMIPLCLDGLAVLEVPPRARDDDSDQSARLQPEYGGFR